MRRPAAGCRVLLALLLLCAPADAGVLERVRHDGVLRCGAEPRTAVAEDRGAGRPGGVAVDACRAVAVSVLGDAGRIAFRLYRAGRDLAALRDGADELAFVTPDAIADEALSGQVIPGPVVSEVPLVLLVPPSAPARRTQDLAGQPICFMIGSGAQHELDASFRRWHLAFLHMAFEEEDEMADAYAARRCLAIAGEAPDAARLTGGTDRRILAPPIGRFAIIAATPAGDRAWSACVARILGGALAPRAGAPCAR